MNSLSFAGILLTAVVLSGCYHVEVITGREPGTTVIEKEWAMSYINGLIPPEVTDVSDKCPNGVAVVESEMSILNVLASAITFGIISPMHITVTCAAGGMMGVADEAGMSVSRSATDGEFRTTLTAAAAMSAELGGPVRLRLTE